jgi:competence protein ComEC
LAGPEVATRVIAPFLWSRGHHRIDEVFLSHADLDHFNGLPALLERFRIGQVSMNPSFADKTIAGVRLVLDCLERSATKLRVLRRGEILQTGDLRLEVLHPPAEGPPGTENARSLVLGLSYGGSRLLFTGDLEPPGLGILLSQPPWRAAVLVAPHHGSVVSNTPALADWVAAELVIISDHVPARERPEPYTRLGAQLWPTFSEGAVLLSTHGNGWTARSYATQKTWLSSPAGERR